MALALADGRQAVREQHSLFRWGGLSGCGCLSCRFARSCGCGCADAARGQVKWHKGLHLRVVPLVLCWQSQWFTMVIPATLNSYPA
jgi:hypothetical protein